MSMSPEILLVGTGAVGSFYSGKLQQAGARVSALCRSDYEAVKKSGIAVKSVLGDFHFTPELVVNRIEDYGRKPDYIIVSTKVLPEIKPASIIAPAVAPGTSIFMLQNGIGVEDPVAAAFPENEIISGLAFICVSRTSYGRVEHQDYGRIVIGRYPSGLSEKAGVLEELFKKSGVPCEHDASVATARWKKLIWNAPFNPMSVLGAGADTKEMMGNPASRHLAKKVMEEVALLAGRLGHEITEAFIQKILDDTAVMKPYKTSMLLDFENKRPMEVEAILGRPLAIAGEKGLCLPYMESLYGLLTIINERFVRGR